MEEIDLTELFLYFKSKIALIIGITFLILLLGNLYAIFLRVPLYKSSSTIVIASNNNNVSTIQTDITVNQKLVGTYKEIVKSRSVVDKVINELNLDYTYEELSNNIEVSAVENTEVLKISVLDKNATKAKKITSTLSDAFKDEVIDIYNLKNVKVLDKASTPAGADNVNFAKDEVIFFGIGLVLSFMIVFIMFYFDKNIRSVEQVESRLGLPILGTIPINGGKK